MGIWESPVAPFDNSLKTICLQEVDHILRGKIEECRFDEVRVGADVLAEFIPRLDIGEVTTPFSCEKNLTARTRHLLENCHFSPASFGQRFYGSISRHQASGTATYYDYV